MQPPGDQGSRASIYGKKGQEASESAWNKPISCFLYHLSCVFHLIWTD